MNEIMLWYNKNRSVIWKIAGVSLAIVIAINLINAISHNHMKEQSKENDKDGSSLMNTISMEKDESTVSGKKLEQEQKDSLRILDEFAEYCNIGNIDGAYSLLSEDCKKEMYPTKEVFERSYYNVVFNANKKTVSAENWVENIYKIKYKEDALSTGISNDQNTIQDYITIIKDENGDFKLNVNGYIGKEKINKTEKQGDIEIKVVETNMYMDFQTYTYEIVNNSDKTILLNDPNLDDTMYIEDKSGIKYQAYTHEISSSELKISSKEKKDLTIKYYSKYSSNKIIKSVAFARIILDYGAYSNYQNIGYYNNYGAIQIKL